MKSSEMWLLVGVGVVAYLVLSKRATTPTTGTTAQNALNSGIATFGNTINRGLNSLFPPTGGALTYQPAQSPLSMGNASPGMEMGNASPGVEQSPNLPAGALSPQGFATPAL